MKLRQPTFLLYVGMFILVTGVSVIQSCTQDPADALTEPGLKGGQVVRYDGSGFHLQMNIPQHPTDSIPAQTILNENTGELDINAGDNFGLRVIQESRSVEQFRQDMQAMSLFSMRIVEETPELLIYQTLLPDGTAHFFHIYATRIINGVPYTIRSAPESDFTEADVVRMKEALNSLRPL
ncbi:MAG: hypothetical protein RL220_912 [Bacteroidota bacterium]